MDVKFVLYVIYQTLITTTLCGVTLPFPDLIGKVTPVKPTPLTSSSSLPATKTPLIWDGEDIMADLFAPSETTTREFSSPLILKSSSKPMPVPKLDTLSLSNIKIPDQLSIQSSPLLKSFPSSISLPTACKSLPAATINLFGSSSDGLLSLPSISSLPPVPIEALQKSPITSFSSNIPLSSSSFALSPFNSLQPLPYQLHYKPMYLPRVNTPSKIFTHNYNPLFYVNDGSLSGYPSLCNVIPEFVSPYLTPIKPKGNPFLFNTAPKIPSFSTELPFSTNILEVKNPWEPIQSSPCIAFKSNIIKPISLPNIDLKENDKLSLFQSTQSTILQDNPKLASSDLLNVLTETLSTKKLTPIIPSTSPILPSDCLKIHELPIGSMTPPCLDYNLRNYEKSVCEKDIFEMYDSIKNFDIPDMFQTVDAFVDNIANINTNDLLKNLSSFTDLGNFNVPEVTSYDLPMLIEKVIQNLPDISPPIIQSSSSEISQTFVPPISNVNISPTSPIIDTSSINLSSINNKVSNITKNILSSCKPYSTSKPVTKNPLIPSKLSSYCTPKDILPVRTQLPPVLLKPISSVASSSSINVSHLDSPSVLLELPQVFTNHLSPSLSSSSSPLSSSISFSPPQLCPSYLPSPVIPGPSTSSSFYTKSPLIKISSHKNKKDLEKLLELMLIAEYLNEDEEFKWDDLDALLALLSTT